MTAYSLLKHLDQMASLLFKLYIGYFMWLFTIAEPETTVHHIGQLMTDKLILALMLSIVILVYGSLQVLVYFNQANRQTSYAQGGDYTQQSRHLHHIKRS